MLLSLLAHILAWMTKMDDRQVAQRARAMDGLNHNSLDFTPLRQNCSFIGFSLSSLAGFKETFSGPVPSYINRLRKRYFRF